MAFLVNHRVGKPALAGRGNPAFFINFQNPKAGFFSYKTRLFIISFFCFFRTIFDVFLHISVNFKWKNQLFSDYTSICMNWTKFAHILKTLKIFNFLVWNQEKYWNKVLLKHYQRNVISNVIFCLETSMAWLNFMFFEGKTQLKSKFLLLK